MVKRYTERAATANEHAREIRAVYEYRDRDAPLTEALTAFVISLMDAGRGYRHVVRTRGCLVSPREDSFARREQLARLMAATNEQETARLHAQIAVAAEGAGCIAELTDD